MFDIYVAQLVLSERKIAYLITNQSFIIIGSGGYLSLIRETQEPVAALAAKLHDDATAPIGECTAERSYESKVADKAESFVGFLGTSILDHTIELIGHEEQLQAVLSGELSQFRLDFINRENRQGELVYLTLTIYPRCDELGQIQGLIYLLEDVTAIGRINQQLTQQHNDLYLLHRQLNESNLRLSAANAELRALDELKSRFVSIAAHELRTPIATMLGYMEFMMLDNEEILPPSQQRHLEIVQRSTKRLLSITTDLLDVTRLEADRLELILESINLPRLIRAVLTEFEPEIRKKQLSLSFEPTQHIPPTLCDEKRTVQIFTNLISNAIKYTPEQGYITIELSLSHSPQQASAGSQIMHSMPVEPAHLPPASPAPTLATTESGEPSVVLIKIVDTGIGIPADDLANMGKPFFRASNAYKSRAQGTGLGLHITHSLCELQGGTLWFSSVEGKGTTAFVTIPIDDGLL